MVPKGFMEYIKKYNFSNSGYNYAMVPITYEIYLTLDFWQAARYSFMSTNEEYETFKIKEPYGCVLGFFQKILVKYI